MEVIIFKPSVFARIKTLLWGLFGAAIVVGILAVVRSVWVDGVTIGGKTLYDFPPIWAIIAIGAVIIALALYFTFFGNQVRFEVEGRSFRHFVKGDLKFTADDLSQYTGGYSQKISNNDVTKQDLELADLRTGVSQTIDCSGLSAGQFDKMWQCLGQHGLQTEAPMLITQPKKEK